MAGAIFPVAAYYSAQKQKGSLQENIAKLSEKHTYEMLKIYF